MLRAESSRPQGLLDEIAELKRIVLTTAQARDHYRADYFRAHGDYMDFKYPNSRARNKTFTRSEIAAHLRSHADAISELMNMLIKSESPVHPDHPAGSREPPHCQSCECGERPCMRNAHVDGQTKGCLKPIGHLGKHIVNRAGTTPYEWGE